MVEWLLTHTKQDLSKPDKFGRTPLILAAKNGHVSILSLLLKYNSSINAKDTSGNCALHYASAYGFIECLELLLMFKAEVHVENLWKLTPIHIAILKRHDLCVRLLLNEYPKEQVINTIDDSGKTLLSSMIISMRSENIDLILKMIENHCPNLDL
jgi:ankyrin repeat protein